MSGLRSSAVLDLRRPRLSGARSTSASASAGSTSSTSSISARSRKPCSSSTSASSRSKLCDRAVDLGEREHAELLAAIDQALDLFEFLQFRY